MERAMPYLPGPLSSKAGQLATLFMVATGVASSFAGELATQSTSPEATHESPKATSGPPYRGTIFVAPDIYLDSDPSAFRSLESIGRGLRRMFDRRANRSR